MKHLGKDKKQTSDLKRINARKLKCGNYVLKINARM
jgi:hypothetical protein